MPLWPVPTDPVKGTRVIIMSYANSETPLCLSPNPADHSQIIVDRYTAGDDFQTWGMIDAGNDNIVFFHWATQTVLMMVGPDGTLGLFPFLPSVGAGYDASCRWTTASGHVSVNWWAAVLLPFTAGASGTFLINMPHQGLAIRPCTDSDRNLNVLGDGPYNPGRVVAAWDGWGGGDCNEVWMPVPF